jgi:nucleoside-diphosphate-sugar epimerase
MSESAKGTINATIARGADFYGAESMNSFFDAMVLDKFAKKKKAMWLGDPSKKHSFTYVRDAGRALYLLGQEPSSGNQVWHVPTAPALTGNEFISLAARVFGVEPNFSSVNKFMLQMVGLFQPLIGETAELYYQYKYDYIFDSSKFENAFGIKATSYEDGFREFAKFLLAKAGRSTEKAVLI